MIGILMRSRLLRGILVLLAVIGGLKVNNAMQRRRGSKETREKLLRITQERTIDGVRAYQEKRRGNDGRDVNVILGELRDRNADWQRLRDLR